MKIGDYVRFDGEIAKIRDIKRYKTKEDIYVFDRILDLNEDRSCNDNTIYNSQWQLFDNVKSSPNIIDLIEVGDYVNEYKVISINIDDNHKNIELYVANQGYDELVLEQDIKSIVTHEQFSQMEYKVGE